MLNLELPERTFMQRAGVTESSGSVEMGGRWSAVATPTGDSWKKKKKVCEVNQLLQDNTNKTTTIKRVKQARRRAYAEQ